MIQSSMMMSRFKAHIFLLVLLGAVPSIAQVCTQLTADTTGGTFESDGFPLSYPNDASECWLISTSDPDHVVNLIALVFKTDACCDIVSVYDGSSESDPLLATWSGNLENYSQLFSTGSQMYVKWSSNSDTTKEGFQIRYVSTLKLDSDCVHLNVSSTLQYIDSTDYSSPSSDVCWVLDSGEVLQRVHLLFSQWNIGGYDEDCSDDSPEYMEIRDGADENGLLQLRHCGGGIGSNTYSSSGQYMYVRLHTSSSVNSYSTFSGEYRTLTESEISDTSNECVYLKVDEDPITLQSPFYPSAYPASYGICYSIYAMNDHKVSMTIMDMDFEDMDYYCTNDYIEFFSGPWPSADESLGRFCRPEDVDKNIKSGRYASIVFHTDAASQHRGFSLEISEVKGGQGWIGGFIALIIVVFVIMVACVVSKKKRKNQQACVNRNNAVCGGAGPASGPPPQPYYPQQIQVPASKGQMAYPTQEQLYPPVAYQAPGPQASGPYSNAGPYQAPMAYPPPGQYLPAVAPNTNPPPANPMWQTDPSAPLPPIGNSGPTPNEPPPPYEFLEK